jgi:prophage regulatory protein
MEEKFLRVQKVAEMLAIGKSTVWLWVKQNKIPQPIHISSRVSVWRLSEINNYIAFADQMVA